MSQSTRCEKMLMSSVSVSNCIKFYQTAEDIGAKDLQKYCAEIISNHWVCSEFFMPDFKIIEIFLFLISE